MVGLVGVQSNEFPSALDLGRQVRAFGLPVVVRVEVNSDIEILAKIVGGSHVSGCLAMLPSLPVRPVIIRAL